MFQIEQTYTLDGMAALYRAVRRTGPTWRRVLRAADWVILAAGAAVFVLTIAHGRANFLLLAAVLLLLALLVFGDRVNAWLSCRRSAPSVTRFADDGYTVTADSSETAYRYEDITGLAETARYFFFFLGDQHGEIIDKQLLQGGDADAFRAFIEEKTGKTFRAAR